MGGGDTDGTNELERPEGRHAIDIGHAGVRKIIDTTCDGVWVFDTRGETTYVSRRMADMLGSTPDELLGANLQEFLDPEDRAAAEKDLHGWLAKRAGAHYQHLLRRDGTDLWTRIASSTIENRFQSIVGLLGMFTDITDRRQMEHALQRAEAEFRIVFDASAIGIVVVDRRGYAVMANAAMLNMLGYKRDEITNISFEDITHADDVAEDRRLYSSLMRGDIDNFRREKRYVTRSGKVLWVHVNASLVRSPDGMPQYAISMVEDITERVKAERALNHSENQLRQALDAARMVIWSWDIRSDQIEWSENLHRVFNLPFGRTPTNREQISAIVAPQDRERVQRELGAAIKGPHGKFLSDYRVIAEDGETRWFEAHGEVERDAAGKALCLRGIVVDVTARKNAEAALRQLQERELRVREEFSRHLLSAQEQERRRLGGELHDSLGQNLSLIRSRVHLALEARDLAPEVAEHLRAVAEIASDCVAEVRSLAQNLRPLQIEQLGLTESINGLIDRVRDSTTTQIDSRIENVDDTLPAEEATHLYRICQEALSNVLRHSGARHASITLVRDVGVLYFDMKDDGAGFDVAAAANSGGLGLTSMRERAQILGGSLDVQSAPDAGTHLRVRIPFTEPTENA